EQYNLGVEYDNGEGVRQEKAEAAYWYRKAADQGYASAQYNLGAMYYNGEGVRQDKSEGISWIRKAARQGFELAQSALLQLGETW
ncbi:MAG: sel1 repeat family protein, partial [Synergistaceae bacterium]|nr:sel1 repeat family protein [Synergistaceae bacterium]